MYSILVTGVGAIIGYGIIDSLRKSRFDVKIVGMDIYSDAIGQYWCDVFEKAIPFSSPNYLVFLKEIIHKHKIDLVMFGTEQELNRVIYEQGFFKDQNVKFVLNNEYLNRISEDKWETYNILKANGFNTINTYIQGSFEDLSKILGIPMLLKPRRSSASKGIQIIYTEDDYIYWQKKLGNSFMVQEIIGDDEREYTAAVFGLNNGKSKNIIIFQRRLSREGSTSKAKVVIIPELELLIYKLVNLLKPVGPTNFQFRFHKGEYLLLEINSKISSSSSIRTAFGYNEPEMCIEYFIEGQEPLSRNIINGSAIRYIKDFIIYDSNNI